MNGKFNYYNNNNDDICIPVQLFIITYNILYYVHTFHYCYFYVTFVYLSAIDKPIVRSTYLDHNNYINTI